MRSTRGTDTTGHRRDRAGAANREHALDARDLGCREHGRIREARAVGRRAQDQFFDSGHTRRHRAHEDAARVTRAAAGSVDPDPSERIRTPPDKYSRLGLGLAWLRHEGAVRGFDIGRGPIERPAQTDRAARKRLAPARGWHFKALERHTVQLARQIQQRAVAIRANASDDPGDPRAQGLIECSGAIDQLRAIGRA
jgi:hypothetical protein